MRTKCQIFDSLAYIYINKQKYSKLETKKFLTIFIGYSLSNKAY
uniref:Retroviral polymerase SH3-like domain-containing protein n=1 Tax=Physcomitrium patens TaxID=3218 RepID=A0A2K1IBH9_PHYPA|nr:hypothetical protein PHYPA_030105 [Physcomitrium patens]